MHLPTNQKAIVKNVQFHMLNTNNLSPSVRQELLAPTAQQGVVEKVHFEPVGGEFRQ